jgi:thymidylate kinase
MQGPPACGKTSLVNALAARLENSTVVSTDVDKDKFFAHLATAAAPVLFVDCTHRDIAQRNKTREALGPNIPIIWVVFRHSNDRLTTCTDAAKVCLQRAKARSGHPTITTPEKAEKAVAKYVKEFQLLLPEETKGTTVITIDLTKPLGGIERVYEAILSKNK